MPSPLAAPTLGNGALVTEIVYVDTFGNVKLGALASDLERTLGRLAAGTAVEATIAGTPRALPWAVTFGDVGAGEPLLYEDSYGRLCIAVNQGDAARSLGLVEDQPVVLRARLRRAAVGIGRPHVHSAGPVTGGERLSCARPASPSSPPPLCSWPRVRVAPARARLLPRRPRLRHRPPRPPRRPRRRRRPAPSPSPSADACAKDSLATKTAGKLTIGTDNPAYPPYYLPREGGNTEPWDKDQGDPTTGKGFESAIAFAVADKLGFTPDEVTWIVVPFANSFKPGPKEFDYYINQVANKPERAETADLSESYYDGNQAVIVAQTSKFVSAKTIAELKDAKLGAQVGTTSLDAIENVIKPTNEASIYDTNDAALTALKAKQIDGIVVDLPTSFYMTEVQTKGNTIVGQLGQATGATPEHWSLVLEKDSPLTACVDQAVTALRDARHA